jgi:hypothetical protein
MKIAISIRARRIPLFLKICRVTRMLLVYEAIECHGGQLEELPPGPRFA